MSQIEPKNLKRLADIRRSNLSIEDIGRERRKATGYGIKASVCLGLMLWWGFGTYLRFVSGSYWAFISGIGTIFTGFLALGFGALAWIHFKYAFHHFYKRRYVGALAILEVEGYSLERIGDKNFLNKWRFYRAENLKQFEESLFDYLRAYRQSEDLLREKAKWARTNAKLEKQLYVVFEELGIAPEERERVLENFSSHEKPKHRKEFLEDYRDHVIHERWRALHVAPKLSEAHKVVEIPMSEEDFRLKFLEKEASRVTSEIALGFYLEALKVPSRREKIRLFKRALSEDIRTAEEEVGVARSEHATPNTELSEVSKEEVRYLSLQNLARMRLLNILEIANGADGKMCREIILALARLGESGGRFNKHYLPEDAVKKTVRRQCSTYGGINFDPTVFDDAVSWLLKHKVLVTKTKTDERTLSLSTNVKNATPEGAEIILMVLNLKRELGNS